MTIGGGSMRSRILLTALYLTSLGTFAIAARLPLLAFFTLTAGAVPGALRSMNPTVRFAVEFILAVVAALWLHPLGLLVQLVMGIAALSISRAQNPAADRAVIGSLIITVVAAFVQPLAALGFVVLAGLSVLALVEGGQGSADTVRERTRLALTLAIIAAVAAAAAGLAAHILPWQSALAILFVAVAYPFLKAFSYVHLNPHARRHRGSFANSAAHRLSSTLTTHGPALLTAILVILGLLLLALIVYAAYDYWAHNEDLPQETHPEGGIIREALTDQEAERLRFRTRTLSPVRRFVQIRLRQAERKSHPRRLDETWREWSGREEPSLEDEAITLYETIRYGDAPDTKTQEARMRHLWPRK